MLGSKLTEDEAVDIVEAHLRKVAWDVISTAEKGRRGIDVHATRDGIHLARGRRGAIALPDDDAQRDAVARVRVALDSLSIAVFWVAEDGSVSEDS